MLLRNQFFLIKKYVAGMVEHTCNLSKLRRLKPEDHEFKARLSNLDIV